jgi:hypothetical protein
MVQSRGGPCLPPESFERLRVSGYIFRQELQRDKATEVCVLGLYTTPMPPPPSFSITR